MAFYDDTVETMIDGPALQARIRELGAQITRDYQGKDLTLRRHHEGLDLLPDRSGARTSICR